jgi:hypothetical protein
MSSLGGLSERRPLGERSRRLASVALRAFAAVLVAGGLGWALGGTLRTPRSAAAAPDRTIAAGPLHVSLDSVWQPIPARHDAPLADERSFAPGSLLPGRIWIAFAAPDDPSLIPATLRGRLDTQLPTPEVVRLAGRPAWRYTTMALPRNQLLELTVAPTRAGVLLVGCQANAQWWSAVAGCADAVSGVDGIPSISPSPQVAFDALLPSTLRTLGHVRSAASGRLRGVRRFRAVAHVARALSRAHGAAAARLRPLAAPGSPRIIVNRLRGAARAYAALATAASQSTEAAYAPRRAVVRRADAALRSALARRHRHGRLGRGQAPR